MIASAYFGKRTSVEHWERYLRTDEGDLARRTLSALAVEPRRFRKMSEICELVRYGGIALSDEQAQEVSLVIKDFVRLYWVLERPWGYMANSFGIKQLMPLVTDGLVDRLVGE